MILCAVAAYGNVMMMEINLSIIVPILLMVEILFVSSQFKAGDIIYNKLCIENILKRRYKKMFVIPAGALKAINKRSRLNARRISITPSPVYDRRGLDLSFSRTDP